ncbi:1580_t:CDS:2, partial [Ambispora gerdemannii]
QLKGVELSPFRTVGEYFNEIPTNNDIHIIVQAPATTGQERINIQNHNLGYLPRQDGLGGTKLLYSANHETFEGISLTDPDISYRSKVVFSLVEELIKRKIILVRAPPYSGKTSLSQLMEYHLVNSPGYSKYRIIRVSMLWGSVVGVDCSWETFGELWKRVIGVSWIEWIGQCQRAPTILILDEVQLIYKQERGIDENKKSSADVFWKTIKGCLQEMTNIYIIMFGAYVYHSANSAGLSTPVEIPPSKCKGLMDIKFTYEESKEYVERFCEKYFRLNPHDVSQFSEYIQTTTEGHVGLIFHILRYTKEAMERRIRENVLTWKDIFAYLNSHDFNLTLDACRASPKVKSFSREQLVICEHVYLNGKILFRPHDMNTQCLVKSGILVVNDGRLYFSAPLIKRSFFQQCYGSQYSAETTPPSLYHFIVKIFTAMCNGQSSKILRDGSPLEQTLQKEFYRIGTQVLGMGHFLSCDVGAVFGCDGYIDFYVDKLDWAIELLRDGKDMTEHSRRFEPAGEYEEIVRYAKSIAIIDIRSESKKVRKLQKDFIHVSCSENYNAFKIECLGKDPLTVKIRD